jgi:hypothetical protein
MLPTTPERRTHDYVRNGTTSLFAAYDLASGSVIAQHYRQHRHQEFLRFLKLIDSAVPKGLDLHLVLDNYATHKTPAIKEWLLDQVRRRDPRDPRCLLPAGHRLRVREHVMPAASFFFDAGSGTALWVTATGDQDHRGYAADLRRLPVSQALLDELESLVAAYDTSLNWDYPPDPGPWREPRCLQFNHAVRQAIQRLREELGPAWQIHDLFKDLHEAPDLDRYLADPSGFTRTPR